MLNKKDRPAAPRGPHPSTGKSIPGIDFKTIREAMGVFPTTTASFSFTATNAQGPLRELSLFFCKKALASVWRDPQSMLHPRDSFAFR